MGALCSTAGLNKGLEGSSEPPEPTERRKLCSGSGRSGAKSREAATRELSTEEPRLVSWASAFCAFLSRSRKSGREPT